ncbi:MAG: hypothetical protein ACREWE_01485 [Gammaproteobacteria bacterium]
MGGYQVCEKWLKDRGPHAHQRRPRPLPKDGRRPRRDHPPDEGDRRGHRAVRRLAGGVPDGRRQRRDGGGDPVPTAHRPAETRRALRHLHTARPAQGRRRCFQRSAAHRGRRLGVDRRRLQAPPAFGSSLRS